MAVEIGNSGSCSMCRTSESSLEGIYRGIYPCSSISIQAEYSSQSSKQLPNYFSKQAVQMLHTAQARDTLARSLPPKP